MKAIHMRIICGKIAYVDLTYLFTNISVKYDIKFVTKFGHGQNCFFYDLNQQIDTSDHVIKQ